MIRDWEPELVPAYGFGPDVQLWLVLECVEIGRRNDLLDSIPDEWYEIKRREDLDS